MQFLLGLNSGFDSTITNILSIELLPTINRAFSIDQHIEKRKEIAGNLDISERCAMAAQRYSQTGRGQGMFGYGQKFQGKRDWKKEK